MGSICGLVCRDAALLQEEGARRFMVGALEHAMGREERSAAFPGAWLACREAPVFDPLKPGQPFVSEDGAVALVCDGRIYNHKRLRVQLEGLGAVFNTLHDAEVILRAYEVHGDAFLTHLEGAFALALYDHRKERLLLARDPAGGGMLHFASRGGVFAFSSGLKPLLDHNRVRPGLNPSALDAFFTCGYIPAPDTPWLHAHRLAPGERLIWRKGRITRELFAAPPDPRILAWRRDDAAAAFSEYFAIAMRDRLAGDVPLGLVWDDATGGAAIMDAIRRLAGIPIQAFATGYDASHFGVLRRVRDLAMHYRTGYVESIQHPEPVAMLNAMLEHAGEPRVLPSAFTHWMSFRAVKGAIGVALAGTGCSTLFGAPPTPPLEETGLAPLLFSSSLRKAFYTPSFRAATADAEASQSPAIAALLDLAPENRSRCSFATVHLPEGEYRSLDAAASAFGVEARSPFVEPHLIALSLGLPAALRAGPGCRVVSDAFRHSGAPRFRWPDDSGVNPPLDAWLRTSCRMAFDEMVLGPSALCPDYLERHAIRRMRDAHLQGQPAHGHQLWAILVFELWLRNIASLGSEI